MAVLAEHPVWRSWLLRYCIIFQLAGTTLFPLFYPGEKGDQLFVIIAGIASVTMQSRSSTHDLRAGHVFGELALLYDCKRTATVIGKMVPQPIYVVLNQQ